MFPRSRPPRARSRAFAMVAVMLTVGMAMILSLSFLTAAGRSSGITQNVVRESQARAIAESGLEMAIHTVGANADWRATHGRSKWATGQALHDGRVSITTHDGVAVGLYGPVWGDGDLVDRRFDPFTITATGRFNGALSTARAVLRPVRRILVVVDDADAFSPVDRKKVSMLQQLGWQTRLIGADEAGSAYKAALNGVHAVYVSSTAAPELVAPKLTSAPVGVVSDNARLADDFGLALTDGTSGAGGLIDFTTADHPIVTPFNRGSIVAGSAPLNRFRYLAVGTAVLARETLDDHATLIAMESGANSYVTDFDIRDGKVIPRTEFGAHVRVLGAAIQSGAFHLPVTVRIRVGQKIIDPFGAFGAPIDGNVNDRGNPRGFSIPGPHPAGTAITVSGRSWRRIRGATDGKTEDQLERHLEVRSNDASPQVLVLRNGDAVPAIPGFNGQDSLEKYIADFVDTEAGIVVLAPHQAIFLFELGVTNLSRAAADFQDLVVVVSLTADGGRGGAAPGRRVLLPWDGHAFDPAALPQEARSLLGRALDWVGGNGFDGYHIYRLNQP